VLPLGPGLGGVGVGDEAQVGDDPSQARRVEAAGGLQQHRFGLDRRVGGEVLGAVGQHGGVGHGELAVGQCSGRSGQWAAEQGSGGADAAVGGGHAHAEPAAQPAGGGGGGQALLGAGGATGVHRGHLLQPPALQAVQQPPQDQDPLGPDGVGQAGQVLGGQPVDRRLERRQPVRRPGRMYVRVHGRNLSSRQRQARTEAEIVDNLRPRSTGLFTAADSSPTGRYPADLASGVGGGLSAAPARAAGALGCYTESASRPAAARYGVVPLPAPGRSSSPETTRRATALSPDFSPVTKAVSPTFS
jgi:hypothetical protein